MKMKAFDAYFLGGKQRKEEGNAWMMLVISERNTKNF